MPLLECWVFFVSAEGTRLWHEHPGYWWRIQWFWVSVETGTACISFVFLSFFYISSSVDVTKLFFHVCLIRYIRSSDPCWKPISPQRLEWASLLNQEISSRFPPSPWLLMLLAKKRYAGISIAAHMVSLVIFDVYAFIYIWLIFYSKCVFCAFRCADPKRRTRICVLHEWWCLWVFYGEVVWKGHRHTLCPQGK